MAKVDAIIRHSTLASRAKVHDRGIVATYGVGQNAQLGATLESEQGRQPWRNSAAEWQCWIVRDAQGATAARVVGDLIVATYKQSKLPGHLQPVTIWGQRGTKARRGVRRTRQTLKPVRTRVFVIGYPVGHSSDKTYENSMFDKDANTDSWSYHGGSTNIAYIVGARRYFYVRYQKPRKKNTFLIRAATFPNIIDGIVNNKAMRSIKELVIISHAGPGGSELNMGSEYFDETVVANFKGTMRNLQERFAKNAKIYVLACWAGNNRKLLRALGTLLGKRGGEVLSSSKAFYANPKHLKKTAGASERVGFAHSNKLSGPWSDHDGTGGAGSGALYDVVERIQAKRGTR